MWHGVKTQHRSQWRVHSLPAAVSISRGCRSAGHPSHRGRYYLSSASACFLQFTTWKLGGATEGREKTPITNGRPALSSVGSRFLNVPPHTPERRQGPFVARAVSPCYPPRAHLSPPITPSHSACSKSCHPGWNARLSRSPPLPPPPPPPSPSPPPSRDLWMRRRWRCPQLFAMVVMKP